jgi:enolase-phosphatase E1
MHEVQADGVVLDIEGTTSSVSYVYDVLFPYVRAHLDAFLAANWNDGEVQRVCTQIARDAGADSLSAWCGETEPRRHLLAEIGRLMDRDAKTTGLKELQGLIWRSGYETGVLRSHVFADVPAALDEWRGQGIRRAVYSSGSVTAQKLFFGHTSHGDLLPLLDAHFDTAIGAKRDPASYHRIAAALELAPRRLAFFSDVVEELDAARIADWQTILVIRPGNAPARAGHDHPVITSFAQVRVIGV